jgi:hypothetical protein
VIDGASAEDDCVKLTVVLLPNVAEVITGALGALEILLVITRLTEPSLDTATKIPLP